MSIFSSFIRSTITDPASAIQAKVSGVLGVVDGVIQSVESEITNLTSSVTNFINGGINALNSLSLTASEYNAVKKDQAIVSTLYNPVKVPIISTGDSNNFSTTDGAVVTGIAPSQPNDIAITPVGPEPPLAFNGVYPFVHTYRSESGHIFEHDDTPGHERIFQFHRSGTYEEINSRGRRVVRVAGDNYTVVLEDDRIHVEGSSNLFVKGNINITCLNDVNIDVSGRAEINVREDVRVKGHSMVFETTTGDMNFYSAGKFNVHAEKDTNFTSKEKFNVNATGDTNLKSAAKTNIEATGDMNIKSTAKINTQAGADINMKAGASFIGSSGARMSMKATTVASMDGASVKLNEGASSVAGDAATATAATDAIRTGLGEVDERDVSGNMSFFDRIYQGADDGDGPATAIAAALASGRVTQEEVDNNMTTAEMAAYNAANPNTASSNTSTSTAALASDVSSPAVIRGGVRTIPEFNGLTESSITPALSLSQHYTLADFTNSRNLTFPNAIRAQNGLTKVDIARNLAFLARNSIEPIRNRFPNLHFSSGFRPGRGSQHNKGQAVDIHYRGVNGNSQTMLEYAQWIKDHVDYDQLILEYNNGIWTHVSYDHTRTTQRRQVLTILQGGNFWSRPPGSHATGSGATTSGLHALRRLR